jgi:catechol 2,3-dioxygenase-like lactoylglutathione lyase family enzyme
MLRTVGIAHFTLGVSDIARSVAFYRDIVGLELISLNGDRMAFFRSAKDIIVLVKSEHAIEAAAKAPEQIHQAFLVEERDFEDSVRFLESHGVPILKMERREDFDSVFRSRSAYFRDPDGNVLEIADCATIAHRPVEKKREALTTH